MTNGLAIRITVAVVAAVFMIGSWAKTGDPLVSLLSLFSAAVFVVSFAFALWDKWFWKIPLVQRIPTVPRNICGTWRGTLDSMWVNPNTGESPSQKTVYVVVRQTASSVTVTLISDESKSKSSLSQVKHEDGEWLLHYIYSNEPHVAVRGRSPIHHGSGVLSLVGNPVAKISGSYWTDRDSKGFIELIGHTRRVATDFSEAEALFEDRS